MSAVVRDPPPSVQTISDVCLKRTCSLDTSAFSALEVLDDNHALYIYLLTYLLTAGHAAEGNSDVVGESHHGYAGVAGAGHRTAYRRSTQPQAVRAKHAAYLEDHVQEHLRSLRLPANCRAVATLCR